MSPAKKIVLGIASFLPVALGITYVVLMLLNMRNMILYDQQYPHDDAGIFGFFDRFLTIVLTLLLPAILLHITLMIIYIIQAVRNRAISETERVIWILAFILFGSIAYPIYFFMRINGVKDEPQVALQ